MNHAFALKLNKFLDQIKFSRGYFTAQFNYSDVFIVFRTILFSFLLIDTFLSLPAASQLWGPDAYIPSARDSGFNGIFRVLNLIPFFEHYRFFYFIPLFGKIIFLALGIFNILPLLSTIFVYICLWNLNNKAWITLHGGNNIVDVVFIYIILMHLGNLKSGFFQKFFNGALIEFGNAIANFAFWSARFQIILVYTVAGLTKLQSHLWRDGVALYYVLNTKEFTHPWAQKIFSQFDFLVILGTYGTLLFQLSFPWLVWNRHLKKYMLLYGTFIHLQISFVMGLFDFGIIVSIMYLLFLNQQEALALRDKLLPMDSLHVGFDQNCRMCMKFANFMKFFDFNEKLVIEKAQSPHSEILQGVPEKVRLDKITSWRSSDQKLFYGFETIYEVVRRMPCFVPFSWVLYVMKFTVGNKIYAFLANNMRKKLNCTNDKNESCSLP